MGNLNLTPQEREVVDAWSRDRHGPLSRLGFYGSVLVPILLFAGYGIFAPNLLAMGFALVGLLIFVGWQMSRQFMQLSIYKSLFRKVSEHETDVGRTLASVGADREE